MKKIMILNRKTYIITDATDIMYEFVEPNTYILYVNKHHTMFYMKSEDQAKSLVKFIYTAYIMNPLCGGCVINSDSDTITLYSDVVLDYRWNESANFWTRVF